MAKLPRNHLMNHVEVLLVRAENPSNIGQTARAMKNFGLSRLYLVNSAPHQTQEAYTLGWKAKDVLDGALIFSSLEDALKDTGLVVGFTKRSGRRRGEPRSLVQVVPHILEVMQEQKVALVFGNEKNGLSNEELEYCHELVMIPTESEYPSLNLSHAVAVAAFSIFSQTSGANVSSKKPERFYATPGEFGELMADFREVLLALTYDESPKVRLLEQTLENISRFFKKTSLEKREFHLFKAFLSRIKEQARIRDQAGFGQERL